MTQSMAEAIASIGFAVAMIVGFYFGMSGKTEKWKWYNNKKTQHYAFWIGMALIVGVLIWVAIEGIKQ